MLNGLVAIAGAICAAPISVAPGQLAYEISHASQGDTLKLAAGTYSGSDCSQTVSVDDITIIGEGSDATIIDCEGPALVFKGNGTTLSHVLVTRSVVTSGASYGLVTVEASAATFDHCVFHGGTARTSGGYAFGGAISVIADQPPFAYAFSQCSFDSNSVEVSSAGDAAAGGGGGAIQIQLTGTSSQPSLVQIGPGTTFTNNSVRLDNSGATKGGSITGGAVNVDARAGNFKILLHVVASSFASNSLMNTAPASIGGSTIEANDLISVAGGGAMQIMTATNSPTMPGTVVPSGVSLSLQVSNSVFVENVAETANCGSEADTGNGGAMAVLGAVNVLLEGGSRFERNTCRCTSYASAVKTGVSEGGAIFLQGVAPVGGASVEMAAANIVSIDSIFEGNIANCTGTSCTSMGGALSLDPVLRATFSNTTGIGNIATCSGKVCSTMGGWIAIINGPNGTDATIGCFNTALTVSKAELHGNNATAVMPPPGWTTPCNPLPPEFGAVCYGTFDPIMGGAISVQNLGCASKITVDVSDTNFLSNAVTNSEASAKGPISYGGAFGAFDGSDGFDDLRGGNIVATFNSCTFESNTAKCLPGGVSSNPYAEIASRGKMSVAGAVASMVLKDPSPEQSIAFDGPGCSFFGAPPEQSNFYIPELKKTVNSAPVSVSSECATYNTGSTAAYQPPTTVPPSAATTGAVATSPASPTLPSAALSTISPKNVPVTGAVTTSVATPASPPAVLVIVVAVLLALMMGSYYFYDRTTLRKYTAVNSSNTPHDEV